MKKSYLLVIWILAAAMTLNACHFSDRSENATSDNNSTESKVDTVVEVSNTVFSDDNSNETGDGIYFATVEELASRDDHSFTGWFLSIDDLKEYIDDATSWSKKNLQEEDVSEGFGYHYRRDGNFIWIMYGVDAGMSKVEYLILRSRDGGETWEFRNRIESYYHGIEDVVISGDCIAISFCSGVTFWSVISLMCDYGDTVLDYLSIYEMLPDYIRDSTCDVYADITILNPESELIEIQWHTCGDESIVWFTTQSSFDGLDFNLLTSDSSLPLSFNYFREREEYDQCFCASDFSYLNESELRSIYEELFYVYNGSWYYVAEEIRLAINEIYANKGYDFTGTEYEQYFSEKSWYCPEKGKRITEDELNPYEKANIDLLVSLEKEYRTKNE